ncbi:MAG: HAD family hydrolase [Synergistaceae bacterium]|jgi:HAD superfamily hydrolase (TIGR01509 family)|nr:HAD family hydrolase [Synergistaceae bacterium]
MRYKNILFDVDGTLVDSGAALCRSFVRVMTEETGRPVREEEYARYWGVPGEEVFRDFGILEEDRIARGVEKWNRCRQEFQAWSPPFPGIEELLEELTRRGFVLGVVTSKNAVELEADFGPSPIAKYLPHRVTADDTKLHKPDPAPLLEMVKRLGADKKDCVYIGDTIFDSRCAEAAGIDFILASWGFLFGEPGGVRAVGRPKRPMDVPALL